MAREPNNFEIQHEAPPIFYCWKFWLSSGKMNEGCTPVESPISLSFLDFNDYGWVYMAIPVFGLFVLVFLSYCFCRGKSQPKPTKQALLSDLSDSEVDEEEIRPRAKSYRAVPVRSANARNFYTVVPIDGKVPLNGGVEATRQEQRIYPRLSTMRQQQVSVNGTPVRGKSSSQSQPKSLEAHPPSNDYQADPTAKKNKNKGERQISSSSSEGSEDEQ